MKPGVLKQLVPEKHVGNVTRTIGFHSRCILTNRKNQPEENKSSVYLKRPLCFVASWPLHSLLFCYNCCKNGTEHHWDSDNSGSSSLPSGDVSHSFWGESPGAPSLQLHPLRLLRTLQEQVCMRKCSRVVTQGLRTLENPLKQGCGLVLTQNYAKNEWFCATLAVFSFTWARQKMPGIRVMLSHVQRSPQMRHHTTHLPQAFLIRHPLGVFHKEQVTPTPRFLQI